MTFSVQILGSNSALAAHGRHPTAQVVQYDNSLFLVDCGEGTQVRMSNYNIKRSKIKHIFISHLHGDHYFGLIGLLTSYHLMRRSESLTIYGPEPLEKIIQVQLDASNTVLNYPLDFQVTKADSKHLLYENNYLSIYSFPVKHRIPTTGFIFEEKVGARRIDGAKLAGLNLEKADFNALKNGEDLMIDGKVLSNDALTLPPYKPRSYVFCSDTCFLPNLNECFSDIDLLYHEATFTKEAVERAAKTFHCTTEQAAGIAEIVNAKQLLIGHFSSKYIDLEPVLEEAKQVFPNTQLAVEGQIFTIDRAPI